LDKLKSMSGPEQSVAEIRQAMGHLVFEWEPARWLDTGFPALNKVLGHAEKGIPYGRLIEVSGLEQHGKTAVALSLAATAQKDGAVVLWSDFENSWDADWARKRGLDPDAVMLFAPYFGTFPDEKEPRLVMDEELCDEAEAAVKALPKTKGSKVLMVVDSIAALTPAMEEAGKVAGQNLRTRMERPMMLSSLLRRWVKLAMGHNVAMILINQLRMNPMAFGDPYYTPGGKAIDFYTHVRVRLRRKERMKFAGKEVGLTGTITASKNKTGGIQGAVIKYRLRTDTGTLEFFE